VEPVFSLHQALPLFAPTACQDMSSKVVYVFNAQELAVFAALIKTLSQIISLLAQHVISDTTLTSKILTVKLAKPDVEPALTQPSAYHVIQDILSHQFILVLLDVFIHVQPALPPIQPNAQAALMDLPSTALLFKIVSPMLILVTKLETVLFVLLDMESKSMELLKLVLPVILHQCAADVVQLQQASAQHALMEIILHQMAFVKLALLDAPIASMLIHA